MARTRKFGKKTFKKTTFRKPLKGATKRGLVTYGVKQYVKRQIHKNIENKVTFYTQQNLVMTAYNQNTSMNVTSLIPAINNTQGVGQQNRIGNLIRPYKVEFAFALSSLPYNLVSNFVPIPQDCLIFFGKLKGKTTQIPSATEFANLWQEGSSSRAPFSNHTDNLQLVNTDLFKVYKILRFKIGNSIVSGQGTNSATQYYANNDYKLSVTRRVNITKWIPKVVRFNDTSTNPTNDNLYMWCMCNPADGSTAAQLAPIKLTWQLNFIYEDA